MPIESTDVQEGILRTQSFLRPTYLFAVDEALISYRIGTLKPHKVVIVIEKIKSIL